MKQPRHILRSQQFDRVLIEQLFQKADAWRSPKTWQEPPFQNLGRLAYFLFYEPSTRTRFSFESAANRLGLHCVSTENAREFSSAIKGETLEDSIRVLNQYEPSVIIIRHHETGAAERAAAVSDCPIINAGDGSGQHPTQALIDVYTIWRELKHLENLTVVIGGDLAYGRTARSLAYLLAKFPGVKFCFVSPPALRMGKDILEHLDEHDVAYREADLLSAALPNADVVYWTRIQKERLPTELQPEAKQLQEMFTINEAALKLMKPKSIILHPLPRLSEISTVVDTDPRAAYFRQAGNGVWLRMALLEWVLA